MPGEHTVAVMEEAGFNEEQISALIESDAVQTRWKLLRHYLPQ